MSDSTIRFNDGAAYERYMGQWSQLAGDVFLDWLSPRTQLEWLDVGCGNGAFTQRVIERCAPRGVQGVDPSEEQLTFARTRTATSLARFQPGHAMALPFPDDAFDVAAMALVIFFVPEPARGVAEMARVVRPGGLVSAYAWDIPGGGFPYAALNEELEAAGVTPMRPPSVDAARIENLRELWRAAGFASVETREIAVRRTFTSFDDFWDTARAGPSQVPLLREMAPAAIEKLKERLRVRLPADALGRISYGARANAIKGIVPATKA